MLVDASDALDKLRFLSVTEPSHLGDAGKLEMRIKPDLKNGTITITYAILAILRSIPFVTRTIEAIFTLCFHTIAEALENKELGVDNDLIGQFGVGFYSAFLVADKVSVSTKSPRSDKQYIWEAVADSSSYVINEETDPKKLLRRGTQITLHLRPDDKYEFSEPTRVSGLVKNYSQFVSFPIYTWQEKSHSVEVSFSIATKVEEEEVKEGEEEKPEGEKKKKKKNVTEKYWDWELGNETKPIWMQNLKEVEKEENQEFYKKTFNEFLDLLAHTHFITEGEVEFRSVLYIPGMARLNNEDVVTKTKNIRLYFKRVFISDDFDGEQFPRYLSFVKGVVDSNDLPLNVSREILQESRIAIASMMRAQDVDPKNLEVLLALGVSHTNELEQAAALKYLYRWLQNHPKYGTIAPPERSNSLYYADVARLFNEAAQISPDDVNIHIVLGVLYNLSREHDKAIGSFQTTLELKSRDYSL
ncbi:hypothetical protein GIB67_013809 [Kingdonia uniflora]|uniref:Heat shock protein 90 n=1 Tax=Kingdonia uniflora TaxID=39325 RepID=A0A7J7N7V9_9MAGN|nr:hypothetical protein GIB67_013809 [Kingdonia uniflora]